MRVTQQSAPPAPGNPIPPPTGPEGPVVASQGDLLRQHTVSGMQMGGEAGERLRGEKAAASGDFGASRTTGPGSTIETALVGW